MKIETLTEIFNWLEKNTKNFTVRDLKKDILKVNALIQRQLSNVESGFITKEQLPIAIWFNVFNDHILINGNKRLAFILYHLFGIWCWEPKRFAKLEYSISNYLDSAFADNMKAQLKYLEDK